MEMIKKFFKLKILNNEILYIVKAAYIVLILNLIFVQPLPASENAGKMPDVNLIAQASLSQTTIGVIIPGDIQYYRNMHGAFISKLDKEGYGARVKIFVQKPYPDHISMRNAIRKLAAMDVDLIVAYGTAAALAAIDERTKIPIVYAGVYEPLMKDIKAKNITGVSVKVPISSLLRYLNEIKPISTLGVVYCMFEEESVHQLKEVIQFSDHYKFKVEIINVHSPHDVIKLSSQLLGKSLDAIFITSSANVDSVSSAVIDISRDRKIPAVSLLPHNKSWPMIALFNSPEGQGVIAASAAVKIINGVPPSQIKRVTFADIELVFNPKEAMRIGLKLPINLMTEATRLIE